MRTQIAAMFLCLSVGFATAHGQDLKIDFSQTGGPVEPGYQAYRADHEVAATFTAQSFQAFGTTITILPTWASGATAAAMQMIDRTSSGRNGYTGEHAALIADWIGTDTRQPGNPMTLTITGLPAGPYNWLSYHHDTDDQTGIFSVTVNDAAGSATTTDIDISHSETVAAGNVDGFENVTTFATEIISNGTDSVTLVFRLTSATDPVGTAFFVMNGFELTGGDASIAVLPTPTPDAVDVPRDGTILSWAPGEGAVAHDVYFGMDSDDIDDGMIGSAVYRGRQDVNSFDPGRLEFGTTYYWRIDEIASDGTVSKGYIWSFTVEPVSVPLAGSHIRATASTSKSANELPGKLIDGSGLSADGTHSTDTTQMWLSAAAAPSTTWIQFDFDRLYKLHQMLVWNHNSTVETVAGLGIRTVTIAYSQDGVEWITLGTTHEFVQAPGDASCTADTAIDFAGVTAKHVKINVIDNWGGFLPQCGLSEVRFMVIPVLANQPMPAVGATGVDPRVPLSWRAGRGAVTHNVYVSDDVNAVTNGTAPVSTVSQTSFDASGLIELGKTYYWRVDEVNDLEAQAVWEGDVWSFTVQQYLPVEDFERYTNDVGMRVFQYWIDGWGFTEPAPGNPGNGTGAMVGYDPTVGDIMETANFHGGVQSMPMVYDSSTTSISEADRTFETPQDWTRFNVKGLVLWFFGDPANTASQMYVKVNGKKVVYDGDAGNLLTKPWHMWYIPLASFTGVDLRKVTTLTIGFEGGQGTVFFDDIMLSPLDRQLVTPAKPATTNLVAFYAMEGNVNSSTGTLPGAVVGAPTYVEGKVGKAIRLNGVQDHVTFEGSLNVPDYSAALWFQVQGGTGERDLLSVYDSVGAHGILIEVRSNGALRFLHRAPIATSGGTDVYNNGKYDDAVWYHVAVVKSADTMTMYINGEQAGSAANVTDFDHVLTRMTLGVLKHDSLSRYFPGMIDEVYLYSRALSSAEIAWLAGRTKPLEQ
ncbi:MAG: discoidin domain-containing protein [Sedimentisphaerales bacterium]|nr:discoidin domain-containing protein [Sedimentisphaerales bacterium]